MRDASHFSSLVHVNKFAINPKSNRVSYVLDLCVFINDTQITAHFLNFKFMHTHHEIYSYVTLDKYDMISFHLRTMQARLRSTVELNDNVNI